MCGFVGKVNFNRDCYVDKSLIKAMCDSLEHRGPDDEGFFVNGNVGLGHRRLSIIDLDTGHQPIFNEDGSIVIVYNGELYNFSELKRDLLSNGHKFKTNTDTEVIVHLYEEHGESCLTRMNGMFSFALWDKNQEKLFLARDRIGIKPLNYYIDNDKVVFGSEIKAVVKDASVPNTIDLSSIDLYLSYGYIPAPFTIFENIRKLLPGHYMTVQNGQHRVKEYWNIKYDYQHNRRIEEDEENIFNILRSSVEMRLISDVPFGAFLSGGVDSSAVVGIMSQICDRPVKTFSIGFNEDEYNELDDARYIAELFKTDHHEEVVKPDAIELVPELVRYYDEPFADSSSIPTYYVSKLAREHVKVVLSGDGGDELFAGYTRYLTSQRDKAYLKLPEFIRCNLIGTLGQIMPKSVKGRNYFRYIAQDELQRYFSKISCFSDYRKRELYTNDFANSINRWIPDYIDDVKDKDIVTQYLYFDSKTYLPDDILVKVDKASMARSLEVRVPILDYRLIEYAATIPPDRKIKGINQKAIFKGALSKLLPDRVFTKKKHGFGVPLDKWFRNELKDYAYDNLLSKAASERGYFQKKNIRYILDEHQLGNRDNSFHIWALLFLELWHQQY